MTGKEKKATENQETENPMASGKADEASDSKTEEKSSAMPEGDGTDQQPPDVPPATETTEEPEDNKYTELNDRFLRLYSEFDNYKRRTAKERLELFKTASEEIIVAMLPVLDDFDRAIKSNEETNDIKVLKEGVGLVRNKFKTVLEKKGLKPMDSHGKPFDTDIHEAMTRIPAPKKKFKGKVMDVLEKGYLLNGKVIRYAKVIVGS